MPDDYPRVIYHDDGRHAVVSNAEQHKGMGPGWSDKFDAAKHAQALRKASGAIGETIVPVTRTRAESV